MAERLVAARWIRRVALIAGLVCAAVQVGPAGAEAAGGAPIAVTGDGVVRGIRTASEREFLGVPYAAAPVGDLRWRPPQEHARWQGIRDATRFGANCAQAASPFGRASTSEDCLFLNVFTPAHADEGLPHLAPVMVWIHGGALVVGESDDFDPAALVARGVVVVTVNYRLGALGFLAHPALAAESPQGSSGNFGLLDQQAALRWVQRNIRAFGGDPDSVTIFGESAGGLSVHSQLVSPLAANLFHRAIVQSGAYMLAQPSLATVEAAGQAFSTRAGCADQTAGCLRGLPVATVLANQGAGTTGPNVDGVVLPSTIGAALQAGTFNRVPVMEGTNHDEWRLFVAQAEVATGTPLAPSGYVQAIAATLRVPLGVASVIAATYPPSSFPSASLALSAVGTDAIFACPARTAAGLLSPQVTTFQYEFDDPNAPMLFFPAVSFPTGAYHAAEIQYLFDLTNTPVPSPGLTPDQARLSRTMVDYWTQFARTGSPNSPQTPEWPQYDGSQRFQSLAPPAPTTATDFGGEHRFSFWFRWGPERGGAWPGLGPPRPASAGRRPHRREEHRVLAERCSSIPGGVPRAVAVECGTGSHRLSTSFRMNAPQKTIVVGVDGSQNAERGLRWAIEQAREANAEILAVYAISPPPYRAMGMYVSPAVGFDEEWLSQVKSVFQNEWCRPLKESGVPYRTFIGEGDPAAVIIRVADEQDADMIVLGRRGLGGFEALLLGSVSSKVAHHSHKPVLLISP